MSLYVVPSIGKKEEACELIMKLLREEKATAYETTELKVLCVDGVEYLDVLKFSRAESRSEWLVSMTILEKKPPCIEAIYATEGSSPPPKICPV